MPQAPLCHRIRRDFAVIHGSKGWRNSLLYGRTRGILAAMRAVRRPFEARTRWRDVSLIQFQAFLREYPGALEQRPRITRKSGHSEWTDANLGSWPANTVAKAWTRGRNQGYQVRSV